MPVEQAVIYTARPLKKKMRAALERNSAGRNGSAGCSASAEESFLGSLPGSRRRMAPTHAIAPRMPKQTNAARQPTRSQMMPPSPAERPWPVKVMPMSRPMAPWRSFSSTTLPTSAWLTVMMPAAKQPVMIRAATSVSSVGAIEQMMVLAARPATMILRSRMRPTASPMAPHRGWSRP